MAPSSKEAFAAADRSTGGGLAVRAALLLLRGYKVFISPYFRGSCRFLPSCADYASEAIATHGLIRGGWLAARRLSKCHPLCASGYDPVPPARRPMAAGDTAGAASRPISDARAV